MDESEPMDIDPASPPEDPNGPCVHVNHYKNDDMVACYELLHSFYVACLHENSHERKENDCQCYKTDCKTSQNIHACLQCIHFSCDQHVPDHAYSKYHPLFMDTKLGRVFCVPCQDYQCDPQFQEISEEQKSLAEHEITSSTNTVAECEPTSEELEELLKYHKPVYTPETVPRGFENINIVSCYLISLVQSLIYAPTFRDYLLSLKHECKHPVSEPKVPLCFICEMANIVQECYKGETEAFVFTDLVDLYTRRCREGQTMEYEDAAEVFEHLMDNFHKDEVFSDPNHLVRLPSSEPGPSSAPQPKSCDCFIHNAFLFYYEKRFMCNNCHNSNSPSYEELWKLRLFPFKFDDSDVSMELCLKDALIEEMPDHTCRECSLKGWTLKYTPLQYPIILTFELNHDLEDYYHIQCPEFLDMSPYRLKSDTDKEVSNRKYKYYLFAIIEYITTKIGRRGRKKKKKQKPKEFALKPSQYGHYVCYFRKQGQSWVKCNDNVVTTITLEEVLKVKAKMVFYHRMHL